MLKVTVGDQSYSINIDDNQVSIDGLLWTGDLVKISKNVYHLLSDSNSYLIELLSVDQKVIRLKINGVEREATVLDRYDLLLEKLGMQEVNDANHQEVLAPMPGMILDIVVEKGQKVSKGDKLIILEAMKMENIIKSAGEGTVQEVKVEKGMNVEKNQVLIQF